mgnify:CR=1 FL=1
MHIHFGNSVRLTIYLALALVIAQTGCAVTTQIISDDSFSNFDEGVTTGIEVLENGYLAYGDTFSSTDRTTASLSWDMVSGDSEKTAWLATGKDPMIWKLSDNKLTSVLTLVNEQPMSLLWHPKEKSLFIGTGPNGNIYRLDEANSTATLWFATNQKYVWDMVLDKDMNLYAATGTDGCIMKIKKKDEGTTFSQLKDVTNVMTLGFVEKDGKSKLLAGTQNKACVYEFDENGNPYVLYSSKNNEIRSIATNSKGNVFAAVNSAESTPVQNIETAPQSNSGSAPTVIAITAGKVTAAPPVGLAAAISNSSVAKGNASVVMISPNGFVQQLWSTSEGTINDIITTDDFDGVYVARNGKDCLYKIFTNKQVRRIGQGQEESVSKLAISADKNLLYATNNKSTIGKVVVKPETDTASFQSRVLSCAQSVIWGNLEILTEHPLSDEQKVQVDWRTGNTDNPDNGGWSEWTSLKQSDNNAKGNLLFTSERPIAQYAQYRLTLKKGKTEFPRIDKVLLYYIQLNIAPQITEITFPKSGQQAASAAVASIASAIAGNAANAIKVVTAEPNIAATKPAANKTPDTPANSNALKVGASFDVAWNATDANNDKMRYAIAYRADDESEWRQIEEALKDKKVSLSTSFLPDGTYLFKVDAYDDPSNSEDTALSATLVSKSVVFDRTAPIIENLKSDLISTNNWKISAVVTDKLSNIATFEIDTDDRETPMVFLPKDGLFDSRQEEFSFALAPTDDFKGKEYVVTIKATDSAGNQALEKLVLKLK